MKREFKGYGRLIPLLMTATAVAAGIASCSTDECLDNKNSLPLAGFYSSSSPLQAVSLDSLEVSGVEAPGDSLLQTGASFISRTYLPFRLDATSSSFVFKYLHKRFSSRGITDTVTFRYKAVPHFVSAACGAVFYYEIEGISHTDALIDSVTCETGTITNTAIENIKIYFRVTPQED